MGRAERVRVGRPSTAGRRMRLEEVWGRAVFDRSTAQELGTVVGFVVDADEHRVIAIDVGCDEPCVVGWDSVVGIGDGGVIVTSKEAVREPKETEHARLAAGRQLIGQTRPDE